MNIYVQYKTAKQAGILNELDKPLSPITDLLYCWNVSWIEDYSMMFDDVNTLILRNKLTHYTIIVPLIDKPGQELFDLIKDSIRLGLSTIVDGNTIDEYFKEAGKFEFGILNDPNSVTALRKAALDEFAWNHYERLVETMTPEEIARKVTFNYNQTHFQDNNSKKLNRNDLMRSILTEVDQNDLLKGQKVYEFMVTLDLECYKVTRHILIPADLDFYSFHKILISVFDWGDYHLAEFNLYREKPRNDYVYGDITFSEYPNEDRPTFYMDNFRLSDYVEDYPYIYWTYDFGDFWRHKIELLKVHEDFKGEAPYLIEAEYNRPPEDIGGPGSFNDFLEIINDPDHEEYEDMMEWKGNWKPNLTKTQKRPRKIKYTTDDNPFYN